jgi:hypothetical protein
VELTHPSAGQLLPRQTGAGGRVAVGRVAVGRVAVGASLVLVAGDVGRH